MKPEMRILLDGRREWTIYKKTFGDVLHREDGPAVVWPNGRKEWWLNGERHHADGPAVDHADGTKEWWLSGKRHREDGPAVEYPGGQSAWWLDGEMLEIKTLDELKSKVDEFTVREIHES